jgi:hypothetical protein
MKKKGKEAVKKVKKEEVEEEKKEVTTINIRYI